jgi:hypothetical protein
MCNVYNQWCDISCATLYIGVQLDVTLFGYVISQLMLHICRVSKTFGEWYQKTHKTEEKVKTPPGTPYPYITIHLIRTT